MLEKAKAGFAGLDVDVQVKQAALGHLERWLGDPNTAEYVPLILILERRGKLAKSTSFGIYVAMYATIRFATELLRTDTTFRFLGVSRNGWVSVAAFLFGVGWIIWSQRRGEARTLYGKATFFSPQPANAVLEPSAVEQPSAVSSRPSDAEDVTESVDQHRPSWARKPGEPEHDADADADADADS